MSKYFTNQICDACRNIEKTLTKFEIGRIKHHICYDCLANITLDLVDFAIINLHREIEEKGYQIQIHLEQSGEVNITPNNN